MSPHSPLPPTRHGSAVVCEGGGVLVTGAPGSGKSSLLLALVMQHGGTLIADDQVGIDVRGGQVWLSAPPALAGILEVRGLGLVRVAFAEGGAPLRLLIRLVSAETLERLPLARPGTAFETVAGMQVPCVQLAARDPLLPLKTLLALQIVTGQREVVDDIHG